MEYVYPTVRVWSDHNGWREGGLKMNIMRRVHSSLEDCAGRRGERRKEKNGKLVKVWLVDYLCTLDFTTGQEKQTERKRKCRIRRMNSCPRYERENREWGGGE